MSLKLTPLGTRGWMPIEDRLTMSFLIMYKNTNIILDCGTGITRLISHNLKEKLLPEDVNILFSHYHLDHTIGVTYLHGIFKNDNRKIRMIGPSNLIIDIGIKEALEQLTKAPIFGTPIDSYPINIEIDELTSQNYKISDINIEIKKQEHKGGSVAIRIDKEICYMTDTKLNDELIEFAQDTKCIIHEALTINEKEKTISHCSIEDAVYVAKAAKAKYLMPVHFGHLVKEEEIIKLKQRNEQDLEILVPIEGKTVEI